MANKLYANFYVGDYDSSAWTYNSFYNLIQDTQFKGKVPLNWAIDPNLSNRLPFVFDEFFNYLTPMDYMTTGDSGAGYVNPT